MGIWVYLNTQCFLIQSGEHTTVVCHIHYYDSSPTQNYVHCIIICITECSSCLALHVHTSSKMVVSLLRVVLCLGLVLCGIDYCGQCQSYDSATHEPNVSNGQDRNDDSEVAGDTNCPTWTLPVVNSPGRCKCGSTLGRIVKCDPETLNISVQVRYCITYDPERNICCSMSIRFQQLFKDREVQTYTTQSFRTQFSYVWLSQSTGQSMWRVQVRPWSRSVFS